MTSAPAPQTFSLRSFTSLLLLTSLLAAGCSGTVLFLALGQRHFLGLDKHGWEAIHINNSLMLLVAATVHIVLNWSMLLGYLKRTVALGFRFKWELAAALAITLAVVAGSCLKLPPFHQIFELHEQSERAARSPGRS